MADEKKEKGAKPEPEEKKGKGKAAKEEPDTLTPEEKKKQKKEKKAGAEERKGPKKKGYETEDFRYIVRIADTDLDGHKPVGTALKDIKGIGMRTGAIAATMAQVSPYTRIGTLKDNEIERLADAVDALTEKAPSWMLNRRFDPVTGENFHLVGPDVDAFLREDINVMKKVRSYKGVRHEAGLPVRGQRTRANGRTGLTVGVQRVKAEPGKEEKKEGGAPGKPGAAPAAVAPAAAGAKPAAGAAPAAGAKGAAPAAGAKPAPGAKPEAKKEAKK